ncbi:MAG: Gfo/Idh/MocA family protein [Armatimonadota bacterium]
MSAKLNRRKFVTAAAAGVAAARATDRAPGANERIGVGFIGVGNRGGQLLKATLPNEDVDVVALCDVYQPYLDKWTDQVGGEVARHRDFRELIERDDVDAVVIATPDHWHALQTIAACAAGKDVYVEKPLSITIVEGRRMVEAARRYERVVQVGTHRRSSTLFPQLRELIQNGTIGKVTVSRCYRLSNMYPKGIGKAPDSDPPPDLDWDMWLGPRPLRPFNENIAPYKFRWWHRYSSQIANWGVHYFDLLRWLLDEEAPASVSAHGGRFAVDDARDIPDTMEAIFEFASGGLLLFGQYEASGNPAMRSGEAELRGTLGTVYASGGSFEIVPERGGQFQDSEPRMEPMTVKSTDGDLTTQHIRNFLDCVKSRDRPNADVEDGHLSTVFSHLGNIALATKSRIEWDPERERITNNKAANQLLHYEYRKPWKLG